MSALAISILQDEADVQARRYVAAERAQKAMTASTPDSEVEAVWQTMGIARHALGNLLRSIEEMKA